MGISYRVYHTLKYNYYQPTFTFDTRRTSNRSSLIPTAGSENPPNPSNPRSWTAHRSVATPIREACLYVGKKFIALSGQLTETRIRYCSISVSRLENRQGRSLTVTLISSSIAQDCSFPASPRVRSKYEMAYPSSVVSISVTFALLSTISLPVIT